jgi:P27 family predicted phage terminase small subunit
MGQRGPRPEPTALKLARGNPGKRPINQDEPELAAAAIKPPTGLSRAARSEWMRLAPELIGAGVLTVGDNAVFREYCEIVGELETLRKLVKRTGHVDAKKLGYVRDLKDMRALLKQFAAELGLTPTSRSGVKKIKGKKATEEKRSRFFGRPPARHRVSGAR